jgi:peptidoglycan hydrolase-like protein with peptidoglycan-binding domain
MTFSTNVIASLGLIGGMSLTTAVLAAAATPAAEPNGSAVTARQPNASSTSSPAQPANGPVPLHRVAVVQEALNSVGANLRIDGIWGPATEAALKHYQQQHGLQMTGELDQATRTQLDPIG